MVRDNLAAHKVAGVAEAIGAVGARVLYLPPYSPDFNPIEACWFVVKQCLRKLKARSLSALDEAIPIALARASPSKLLPTASGIAAMRFVRSGSGLIRMPANRLE